MTELLELLQGYEISGVPAYQWGLLALILLVIGTIIYIGKNRLQRHNNTDLFDKSKHYLNSIGERNRAPLPLMMFLILIVLVVAEALGFAYVFADYVLPDGTGAELRYTAYILAIIISAVLVKMTHVTGVNFYYNKIVGVINNELKMKESYNMDDEDEHIHIDNTYKDNDMPKPMKKINRISYFSAGRKGKLLKTKWIWPTITIIVVLIIASSAYLVRENTYKTQMIDEMYATDTIGYNMPAEESKEKADDNMPAFLADAVNASEEVQHEGKILAKQKANNITYFMLSFLFLAIQCIGIYAGFNWGFAGKESPIAYKNVKGYKE